jgi:hypothetical protein
MAGADRREDNCRPVRPSCRSIRADIPGEREFAAYVRTVVEPNTSERGPTDKAERRAARELVGGYHRDELRRLLEHVRDGFTQLDAGEIDEFELDDLIQRYKRAATKLWWFCGSSGGQWLQAANTLASLRERGETPPDWWDEAAAQHR